MNQQRICANPALDLAFQRDPGAITPNLVGEIRGTSFVEEDGCTFKLPAILALYKATGIMPWGIQTAPESSSYDHSMRPFPLG
jgi:hypothetical protein